MKNLFPISKSEEFFANSFSAFYDAALIMRRRVNREVINCSTDMRLAASADTLGLVQGRYRFSKQAFVGFISKLMPKAYLIFNEIAGLINNRSLPIEAYSIHDAVSFYNNLVLRRFYYVFDLINCHSFIYTLDDVIEDFRQSRVLFHYYHDNIIDEILSRNKNLCFYYGLLDGLTLTAYFYRDGPVVLFNDKTYVPSFVVRHDISAKSLNIRPFWLRLEDKGLISIEMLLKNSRYVQKGVRIKPFNQMKEEIGAAFVQPFDRNLLQNCLAKAQEVPVKNKQAFLTLFSQKASGYSQLLPLHREMSNDKILRFVSGLPKELTLFHAIDYLITISGRLRHPSAGTAGLMAGKRLFNLM